MLSSFGVQTPWNSGSSPCPQGRHASLSAGTGGCTRRFQKEGASSATRQRRHCRGPTGELRAHGLARGALSMRGRPEHAPRHRPAPAAAGLLGERPLRDASLPHLARPTRTLTSGIGAANSSGLRFPNSSASSSISLTTESQAGGRVTLALRRAPNRSCAPAEHRAGLKRPRRAC